tara:strand:+ start:2499 stop:3521 length:1023 start_codon:yes stop_codon:yes gene_type:complete
MNLNNKIIFITGGTGSFGHGFVEYILKNFKPKKIIIFSRDEMKQYEMQKKFNLKFMRYFIGDVRDKERLNRAVGDGADVLIHAAALKIVPTAELDPLECIKTNIYGAENVISVALDKNINNVVGLSTDKAANPINLYGATKLAADKLFVSANNIKGSKKTKFSIVRYGNVFGSRGSVLPLFLEILNQNKNAKLPLTHEKMTRFFMKIEDAVKFVLLALNEMKGGEIFVPKLQSFRIIDLIFALKNEKKGFRKIGLRPGEKMHEVMISEDDSLNTLDFNTYYKVLPSIKFNDLKLNYLLSKNGKKGKKILNSFEYNSLNNNSYMSLEEIKFHLKNYNEKYK